MLPSPLSGASHDRNRFGHRVASKGNDRNPPPRLHGADAAREREEIKGKPRSRKRRMRSSIFPLSSTPVGAVGSSHVHEAANRFTREMTTALGLDCVSVEGSANGGASSCIATTGGRPRLLECRCSPRWLNQARWAG